MSTAVMRTGVGDTGGLSVRVVIERGRPSGVRAFGVREAGWGPGGGFGIREAGVRRILIRPLSRYDSLVHRIPPPVTQSGRTTRLARLPRTR
ncbi:hypothetical protein GCM10010236_51860 [Streptomyces eurythermus]|nr:hypothetical protein GCM10010236_51860 [Streptomyces eurythermus]